MLLLLLVSCWCAQADEYYYDAQDVSMTKLDSERFRHHRAYQALNSHFEVRHISMRTHLRRGTLEEEGLLDLTALCVEVHVGPCDRAYAGRSHPLSLQHLCDSIRAALIDLVCFHSSSHIAYI